MGTPIIIKGLEEMTYQLPESLPYYRGTEDEKAREEFSYITLIEEIDALPLTKEQRLQEYENVNSQFREWLNEKASEYRKREQEILENFRTQAEDYFFPKGWVEPLKNYVHNLAWERGHAYGFSEVWLMYGDVVDEVNEILQLAGYFEFTTRA